MKKSYFILTIIALTLIALSLKKKYSSSPVSMQNKQNEINLTSSEEKKSLIKENSEINRTTEKKAEEKDIESFTCDYSLGYSTFKEEIEIKSLPIQGQIPEWLEGTLYRNGPSIFEIGDEEIESWFDGFGMIHKFKFQNGQISYVSKIIKSDNYTNQKSKIPIKNACTNICKICDCYLACGETPRSVKFNPETLETECAFEFEDNLSQEKVYESAHPHIDKEKKEIINYMTNFGCLYSSYDIYKIPFGSKERKIIASISTKEPSFMHSFAVTKNYIILTEYPFTVNPLNLMFAKVFIEQFQWKPNKGTIFYLVNRENSKVKKINYDAFFAFHHINAYEDNDVIYLDLVAFENPSVINKTRTVKDRLRKKEYDSSLTGKLSRYKINQSEDKIEKLILCDKIMELPRINENYDGKSYKYIYATGINLKDENYFDEFNQLIKVDTTNCQTKIWQENCCYPGEPVFVNSPKNESEDDGVILSVVLDTKNKKSFLLILDAKEFKELARAQLPHHIPFGYHGQFYPKEVNA